MTSLDSDAKDFVEAHVREIQPLLRDMNLAFWDGATSGRDEDIARSAALKAKVKRAYSDPVAFRRVRDLLAGSLPVEPAVRRQLTLLDHLFTGNQIDPEVIDDLSAREAELEQRFYNFRATLDGKRCSNNELRELLTTERISGRRREIWESSKGIGPLVAEPIRELIRRRNAAARSLGFADHYKMALELQEIDGDQLTELLNEFEKCTDEPFRHLRNALDDRLARRFGIEAADLRPWHWDDFFSQDPPATSEFQLDPLFESLEPEQVARSYFARIGLPVDDVLDRSDLYERASKDQHAFCTDIDREGDVRILCNLRPTAYWMGVLLHELGHAVYDKYTPAHLPFLLREPAHTLTTEAIAMFFGRLIRDAQWLAENTGYRLTDEEEADIREQQRLSLLISTRWMLVVVHFERALYENPDRADLNSLWWDLVERYQLIKRPDDRDEPDWATKIHLSLAPVYYHNYLLGELMASQLTWSLEEKRVARQGIGGYLRERVFERGASLPWNELVREATGEPLSPRHFVDQFAIQPAGQ